MNKILTPSNDKMKISTEELCNSKISAPIVPAKTNNSGGGSMNLVTSTEKWWN